MNILVVAPHADDEVIGVGGTIAKRVRQGHKVFVCVVTSGTKSMFSEKVLCQIREESIRAHKLLGVQESVYLEYPAVMLENVPRSELNGKLLEIITQIKPEEVYIPHRGDMQLDHQLVADAMMVAVRPKYEHKISRVYSYETLSETGWNIPNTVNEFIPNVYEDISETLNTKIEAMNSYESQLDRFPNARSLEAMEALAKFRGATVNVSAAEAFALIREIKI